MCIFLSQAYPHRPKTQRLHRSKEPQKTTNCTGASRAKRQAIRQTPPAVEVAFQFA